MKSLLIKNVLLNGTWTDVYVLGNRFKRIAPSILEKADKIIDCHGDAAILPPFYNTHTHLPMSLLRGYADDLELFSWLKDYIWPYEAKMTSNDIRMGTRLAILEMIKSGSVFFNDMYGPQDDIRVVAEEMGVRGSIGLPIGNFISEERIEGAFEYVKTFKSTDLIQVSLAPHAVYTVSKELWIRCIEASKRYNIRLHIHLSETKNEVENCILENGVSPVQYLDSLGVLNKNTIAAHCVHLSDSDIELLSKREVVLAHNPISNMKLASGVFPSSRCVSAGCKITLGTDGNASNNNLDMGEEMKVAALLGKLDGGEKNIPAELVFNWATKAGAEAFGIDAGVIEEGKLADALLVDLNNERMIPCHHLISNWVYSADKSCIKTVICNGDILMEDRYVKGEEEILATARKWKVGS